MAQAVAESGVKRCVLISTDKAVNPTNVMWAPPSVPREWSYALERQPRPHGSWPLRFGNVLGSSGSVIPKFAEQTLAVGPLRSRTPKSPGTS